jgi:hypothetical protein
MLNDHCHRVSTQLQLINIIIIIKNINELSFALEDTTYTAVQRELRS